MAFKSAFEIIVFPSYICPCIICFQSGHTKYLSILLSILYSPYTFAHASLACVWPLQHDLYTYADHTFYSSQLNAFLKNGHVLQYMISNIVRHLHMCSSSIVSSLAHMFWHFITRTIQHMHWLRLLMSEQCYPYKLQEYNFTTFYIIYAKF